MNNCIKTKKYFKFMEKYFIIERNEHYILYIIYYSSTFKNLVFESNMKKMILSSLDQLISISN